MSNIKRYDCGNNGYDWCQGCYRMNEETEGDYVLYEDAKTEIETLRAVLQDILVAGAIKEDEYPLLMARAKATLGGGA